MRVLYHDPHGERNSIGGRLARGDRGGKRAVPEQITGNQHIPHVPGNNLVLSSLNQFTAQSFADALFDTIDSSDVGKSRNCDGLSRASIGALVGQSIAAATRGQKNCNYENFRNSHRTVRIAESWMKSIITL